MSEDSTPSRRAALRGLLGGLTAGVGGAVGLAASRASARPAATRPTEEGDRCPSWVAPPDDPSWQPSPELGRHRAVVKVIGRILADPRLVRKLWVDPAATASAVGLKLTADEINRVKTMPKSVQAKVEQWAKEVQLRPPDGP